jgi:heterodisulfide reductase subunit A
MSEKKEEPRIGVYTCHCGGNISDVVRCEQVATSLRKLPNVVVSSTDMSMCSDAGQAMVEADIIEHGLNCIVIGACSPSLHEQTFRGTVARAGLNPYLYHHVGIREQDSWVHKDDHEGATQKAVRLMASGIGKARLLEPLEPIRLTAEKRALVIGGGIAGLRSAWDLARRGLQVTLIEKTPFLGGRMAQLESVFPTGEAARDLLHDLIEKVTNHPNVTIFTRAELVGMSGFVGDYQATIQQQSRGVKDGFTAVDKLIENCPLEVPDEFNHGLTKRKAIYRAYPGCYPATPAVDWENCNKCGDCLKSLNGESGLVSLENEPREFEVTVGVVVVATGFSLYEPHPGEYGYGEHEEVITLAQLIRLLALNDGKELVWNGRAVKNIALIHCVGSRQLYGLNEPQPDGEVNNYCSRICCTATLHTAVELRERFPDINVFDFYEDIRTYGRGHEEYYTEASQKMVRFLRFHDDELPQITTNPSANGVNPLLVTAKDYLTWGEEIEAPVDLVVLATGVMPNPIDDIIKLLKIAPGTDRFLLEVHPKLRPVETAVPGVVLAGTAQGPMNIQESCAAASAAAAKVAVLLGQGRVELEPFVALVDPARCDGSGECVAVCPYEDAIVLETVDGQTRAVVTPANCVGCGSCVSACPNQAIDLQGWTISQYDAMVDALVRDDLPMMEVAA